MPQSPRFDQAMLELSRINVAAGETVRTTLNRVARVAVSALGIGRFSIWLSTDHNQAVRLYYLHRPGREDVIDGTILRLDQFPSYFAALASARALAVTDALTDQAVAELRDGYIRPLGVGALLDAPIWRSGRMVGVVCHEHVGGSRTWTAEEHELAADVAATVARLFEEGGRHQAEDSLRAYQRSLMELSRYEGMGRLAGGVAHDLNNLLHVVGANAELAMEHAVLPEVRASLETVLDAVARSRELARSLLRFGRSQGDGPVVIDPADLVVESKRLLLGGLAHNQQLHLEPPATHSRVFAPRAELERVLLNLVTNAGEAMPAGGTVTIAVREVIQAGSDGGEVAIEVRDNGPGMAPATLAQVGNPFFTTKPNGTGLGLAMADQILTRAGGTLQIESAPGEGTTVRCLLPMIA
ncbi:MAG TPA: ATP-binding protein [Gemmatimonadales bacterium]|nr:ATP-binding protein [Gemmatimonadales bacterium]